MLNVCVISVFHPTFHDENDKYDVLKVRQMWLCANYHLAKEWELILVEDSDKQTEQDKLKCD